MAHFHRHSIRLPGYDYSQSGYYFVTICAWGREYLFGEIVGNNMHFSKGGHMAKSCWQNIPIHYPQAFIDAYIVMPNHIHGIIVINHSVGANNYLPLPHGTSKTIGSIIRGFKIGVTRWFHEQDRMNRIWQRNYYEHIIRNEREYHAIKQYVQDNPKNWEKDELYQ